MFTGLPPNAFNGTGKGSRENSPTTPLDFRHLTQLSYGTSSSPIPQLTLPGVESDLMLYGHYGSGSNGTCNLLNLLEEQWFGRPSASLGSSEPFTLSRATSSRESVRSSPTRRSIQPIPNGESQPIVMADSIPFNNSRSRNASRVPLTPYGDEDGAPVMPLLPAVLPAEPLVDPPTPTAENGGGKQEPPAMPALGTWATRQRFFALPAPAGGLEAPAAAPEAAATGAVEQQPAQPSVQRKSSESSMDDEAYMQAAWRYRFGRRWAAEQERAFDPAYGKDPADVGTWDEALGYLAACPDGLNMQVARTISLEKGNGALGVSLLSNGSSNLLDGSTSRTPGVLREASSDLSATKELVTLAQRARKLMYQQSQIEQQAARQVSSALGPEGASGQWVGQYIEPCNIDNWGRFKFVLLRVYETGGNRHKMVVRGKNYASDVKLIAQVAAEADAVRLQHVLPHVKVQHVGSGIMEWSKDRERRLHVIEGKVIDARDVSKDVSKALDITQWTAALVRAHLPLNYSVSTVPRNGYR